MEKWVVRKWEKFPTFFVLKKARKGEKSIYIY